MTNKTKIIYDKHDPNQADVKFIAIETQGTPYVFATYFSNNRSELQQPLADHILLVSKEQAFRLFGFQKGSISDLVD